jgi:hypothetical protein
MLLWLDLWLVRIMKFRIVLSIKITQILLICFSLIVKLKGKRRVTTQVQRLIFLYEELIHGSAIMDVQPHRLLHQVEWCLLCPTTVASLELLPQIQQLRRLQQERIPLRPSSLLHLQAERETYNVTGAKGLDMLCMIVPPSMFWSLKMVVSTLQLVISMRIHLLCLPLTMQVMMTTPRSILVPVMQITVRA